MRLTRSNKFCWLGRALVLVLSCTGTLVNGGSMRFSIVQVAKPRGKKLTHFSLPVGELCFALEQFHRLSSGASRRLRHQVLSQAVSPSQTSVYRVSTSLDGEGVLGEVAGGAVFLRACWKKMQQKGRM